MLRYIFGVSLITVVIMIIRALTEGKMLRKHQYALWLLIPLFMIVSPFIKIGIPVNMPVPAIEETVITDKQSNSTQAATGEAEQIRPIEDAGVKVIDGESEVEYSTRKPIDWNLLFKNVGYAVSITAIAALVIYNAGFMLYCRNKRRYIDKDPVSGLKIFDISHKGTPFLLFNKIYVDSEMEGLNEYIICHEACHFRHGDFWWIILRYLVLALNWYNPFIWAAFILSGRDCELACDEEVIRIFGESYSREYATTLLDVIGQRSKASFGFSVSTGMRGEYKIMKKRLLAIKHPAKKSYKALALSLATIVIFSGCATMEPVPQAGNITESTDTTVESAGVDVVVDEQQVEESIQETKTFPSEFNIDYSGSPLVDTEPGEMEDGYYMVAMTPVRINGDDGSISYVFYPWKQFEVGQDYMDFLQVGNEISMDISGHVEIDADLNLFTVQNIEYRTVDDEVKLNSQYKYMTEYTGERVYVRPDEERGLNFRETVNGSWVLWEYDLPVMIVSEPTRLKIAPDLEIYDAFHFFHDHDNGIIKGLSEDDMSDVQEAAQAGNPVNIDDLTPEQRRDVMQFRDTSLTKDYVGSIDEFFMRGGNPLIRENSYFDSSIDSHTLTGIRVENGVITEIYFYC